MKTEIIIEGVLVIVNGLPRPSSIRVLGLYRRISIREYKDWWRHQHHGSFEDYVRSHPISRSLADGILALFSWMKTPDLRPSKYQGMYNQHHKNIKHQYK